MRLIVGLGNPGIEYQFTPHNLGFLVVDRLAEAAQARVERPEGKSLIGFGDLEGQRVMFVKPLTYMNLSGIAVRDILERAGETPESLLVIVDDLALPRGTIRIRPRGSSGGHNGLHRSSARWEAKSSLACGLALRATTRAAMRPGTCCVSFGVPN